MFFYVGGSKTKASFIFFYFANFLFTARTQVLFSQILVQGGNLQFIVIAVWDILQNI